MSGSLPMAVDGRNLTYRYGQFTAVDDVTLQVRPGETMGLLGPNGAGKTTMVRMLTTLTPVQHGELRIFGMDARRQTTDIRSNIGYVPQQLSIEPALTGRQNVAWFARLYGVPRNERADRVDQALVAMDLIEVNLVPTDYQVWVRYQDNTTSFNPPPYVSVPFTKGAAPVTASPADVPGRFTGMQLAFTP